MCERSFRLANSTRIKAIGRKARDFQIMSEARNLRLKLANDEPRDPPDLPVGWFFDTIPRKVFQEAGGYPRTTGNNSARVRSATAAALGFTPLKEGTPAAQLIY